MGGESMSKTTIHARGLRRAPGPPPQPDTIQFFWRNQQWTSADAAVLGVTEGGQTIEEAALATGLSPRSVEDLVTSRLFARNRRTHA